MTEAVIAQGEPTLEDVLLSAFGQMASELRVALPGQVLAYDSATQLATVQPAVQRRYRGRAQVENLPAIPRVPIVHPRTAKAAVLLPVAKGDQVLLVFADRALDNWLRGDGGPKEPLDARQHHLSDAFAIPGGWPERKPLAPKYPGALELRVASGTKVAVTNGTNELLTILHELLNYIETQITFTNGGGPTGPPSNASLVAQIRAKLETLKP